MRPIALIRGDARSASDHEIEAGDRRLSFAKTIIATGARRAKPPIAGLAAVDFLTNRSALTLETLRESLIVVGAGYVGLEFAQMYARFGTRVTLLGRNPRVAAGEDPQLSDLLLEYLREEGIDAHTETAVTSVGRDGSQTALTADVRGEATTFRAESLLLATGRVGNTDDLLLGNAGVDVDARGFVRVDEQLNTTRNHVWAVGDVKGGWMFTHVATYDGPIAALNAVKGIGRRVDYRVVPRAIFTGPTLAAVGLTEREARERGHDVAVGTVRAEGARAKAIGDARGVLKAFVDARGGQILGFHVLAPHADNLLHEAVAAMHDDGTIDRITKSIHVHPTLSEMVKSAARAAA